MEVVFNSIKYPWIVKWHLLYFNLKISACCYIIICKKQTETVQTYINQRTINNGIFQHERKQIPP